MLGSFIHWLLCLHGAFALLFGTSSNETAVSLQCNHFLLLLTLLLLYCVSGGWSTSDCNIVPVFSVSSFLLKGWRSLYSPLRSVTFFKTGSAGQALQTLQRASISPQLMLSVSIILSNKWLGLRVLKHHIQSINIALFRVIMLRLAFIFLLFLA